MEINLKDKGGQDYKGGPMELRGDVSLYLTISIHSNNGCLPEFQYQFKQYLKLKIIDLLFCEF